MVLNSTKNSFPQSTMTLLGSGYLVSHARSTTLDTRSAREDGTVQISIQPVDTAWVSFGFFGKFLPQFSPFCLP